MIFDKVKEVLVEVASCNEDDIRPDSRLLDDLLVDSLDLVQVELYLDDIYNCDGSFSSYSWETVGDIVKSVEEHRAK